MAEINVAKPFNLLHRNGDRQHFSVGVHTVDEETAQHWYVQEHLASDSEDVGADDGASEDGDDKAVLLAKAKTLGLTVDGRWTADKISAAIAEAQADKD